MFVIAYLGLFGIVVVAATKSDNRGITALAFPDLLPDDIPSREKWQKLGKEVLWNLLTTSDLEFVDSHGNTVPPAFQGAKVQQHRLCGRIARLWVS